MMEKLNLHNTCTIRKLVINYLDSLDKGFLIQSSFNNKVCEISWTSKEGKDGLFLSELNSKGLKGKKRYIENGKKFPGEYKLIIDISANLIDFYYYPSLFRANDFDFRYEPSSDGKSLYDVPNEMLKVKASCQYSSGEIYYRFFYDIKSVDDNDLDKLYYLLEYTDIWNKNKNNILNLEYLLDYGRPGIGSYGDYYRRWYLHKTFDLSDNCDNTNVNSFIRKFKEVIKYLLDNPLLVKEIVCLSVNELWNEEFYEKIINGEVTEAINNEFI